ncbi:helix-turn-helix domain-containing protein [Auritidibacter ignavus]|uniref:helix-turn-helix domain-containing protein n=1 Tax=Auritidibacter ignavus TaxID=678932 RepID=UPI003CC5F8E7
MAVNRYYTVQDVARLLGVSEVTVYRHIRAQRWPAYRFGRLWRFSPEQIQQIKRESMSRPSPPVERPHADKTRRLLSELVRKESNVT